MANQLFTWVPDEGSTQSVEPRVLLAKFGDGYEQRTNDGINHMPEVWSVSFSGNTTEIGSIVAFLKAHGGSVKFDWVTPFSDLLVFVCKKWSISRQVTGVHTLTAEFNQVFEA